MTQTSEIISFILLLIDLFLFLYLALRTLTNMYARGARSLLLMLFIFVMVTAFHIVSLLVANPQSRAFTFIFELFFFMLFPAVWWEMTYELTEFDTKHSWKMILPLVLVNFAYFGYLQFTRYATTYPAFVFTSCTKEGFVSLCDGEFSPVIFAFFGLLMLEIIGGVIYLVWFYYRYPHFKDRSQIITIAVSFVSMPLIIGVIVLLFGPTAVNPMPVSLFLLAVLLFNAVYNHRILMMGFSARDEVELLDDLLLVVDNNHVIQDFNLSTLQVFGLQVRNLVNVKLEHAFIDKPAIIDLFENDADSGNLRLVVDGISHQFEPTLRDIIDTDTGDRIGKRLELHDVTKRNIEPDTTSIVRDRLTNQYTKETFFSLGSRVFSNMKRMGHSIALVVLDIDDFQMINSRYTWVVGDEALVQMVEIIQRTIRNTDLLARFDSDNFVLMLPQADEPTAYQICTRIKEAIATHIFEYEGQEFQFTISQGYTVYDGSVESSLEGFYETARAALMQSRAQGRNRLVYQELRKFG